MVIIMRLDFVKVLESLGDKMNNSLLGCAIECKTCESLTVCFTCAVGYVYFNQTCPVICPDGYYDRKGICTGTSSLLRFSSLTSSSLSNRMYDMYKCKALSDLCLGI